MTTLVSFILVLLWLLGTPNKAEGKNASDVSFNSVMTDLHAHIHKDQNGKAVFGTSAFEFTSQESLFFVKKIFLQYGNEQFLAKHNLVEILKNVGLFAIIENDDEHARGEHDNSNDEHSSGGQHDHSNADHIHIKDELERQQKSLEADHFHSSHDECLGLSSLLEAFHMHTNRKFSQKDFIHLCPAVIQQLTINDCSSISEHVQPQTSEKDEIETFDLSRIPAEAQNEEKHATLDRNKIPAEAQNEQKHATLDLSTIPAKVWGFSTIAVMIISLAGLVGMAVIPIMKKVFYTHLLQFLVALAIGALSGDALIHLLPHAIAGTLERAYSHVSKEETAAAHVAMTWKGLIALGGVLLFFIAERLLGILVSFKHGKKSKNSQNRINCVKYCDVESKSKEKESVAGKLNGHYGKGDNCDKMVMLIHQNKALKGFADATHDEVLHQFDEEEIMTGADKKSPHGDEPDVEHVEGSTNDVLKDHSNFGHSHGGHSHGPVPKTIAAIAWMMLLGDGIHNFSDGLAIGASFANSITGGLSTSVAIFCHELPHEIGDFVVLLRAGMSPKQAVLYSCLSSLLCFVGMLIGVAIGNISSSSLWVFAAVGGMFLYIALVDMLPELTTVDPKKGENPFLHLLLQVMGIVLGSSVMFLIALYEKEIKKAFG